MRTQRPKIYEHFWFLIQVSHSSPYRLFLQWYVWPQWDNHRTKNPRNIWKTVLTASVHFYCTVPWLTLVKMHTHSHKFIFGLYKKNQIYVLILSPRPIVWYPCVGLAGSYLEVSKQWVFNLILQHIFLPMTSSRILCSFVSPISSLYMPYPLFRMGFFHSLMCSQQS